MAVRISEYAAAAGFREMRSSVCRDIGTSAPEAFRVLCRDVADIQSVIDDLRVAIPIPTDATEGVKGSFYRLPNHRRSVCCSLRGPDSPYESDVVIFKGTEPLSADFDDYISWMATAKPGELPIAYHFPLVLKTPPGALPLDECGIDWRISLELHEAHVRHYGTLAHAPLPLLLHEYDQADVAGYLNVLARHLPGEVIARVQRRISSGLGILVYYYPSSPIRVLDLVSRRKALHAATGALSIDTASDLVELWTRNFARLLLLGYVPYAFWNKGWGACVDPGNTCMDGGFADVSTLVPQSSIPDEWSFYVCVQQSVDMFAHTVSKLCALVDTDLPTGEDHDIEAAVADYLWPLLVEAVAAQRCDSQSVDPRLHDCLRPVGLNGLLKRIKGSTRSWRPYTRLVGLSEDVTVV